MDGKPVCNCHESLASLLVPICDLASDPANANLHSSEQIQVIADSLKVFGMDQPLVVQKQGMIVRKGNGRLAAAKLLGWTHLPCLVVESRT